VVVALAGWLHFTQEDMGNGKWSLVDRCGYATLQLDSHFFNGYFYSTKNKLQLKDVADKIM